MRGLCEVASVERSERIEAYASSRPPLIVAGSGAGLVATSILAEAFERVHPEITIAVHGGIGASATLRAVSDGLVAVGLVSLPLRDWEKAR